MLSYLDFEKSVAEIEAKIEELQALAEASGADAISLVNTFVSLAIDPRTRRARIGAGFGGLSGPAIKPIALRMTYEASRAVSYDYGNYSAHLFLADSYQQLSDPNEINLRYETPAESEYLVANLLAPVGAGTLCL